SSRTAAPASPLLDLFPRPADLRRAPAAGSGRAASHGCTGGCAISAPEVKAGNPTRQIAAGTGQRTPHQPDWDTEGGDFLAFFVCRKNAGCECLDERFRAATRSAHGRARPP